MQSVLESLRKTEKGQLIYYTQWSPKQLEEDISPPKLRRSAGSQIFKISATKIALEAIEDDAHVYIENFEEEKEKALKKAAEKETEREDELPKYTDIEAPLREFESEMLEQRRTANLERVRKQKEFYAKIERETLECARLRRQRERERRLRDEEKVKKFFRETEESALRIKKRMQEHQDHLLKTRLQQREERRLKLQLLEMQQQKENYEKFTRIVQEIQVNCKKNLQKAQQFGEQNSTEISASHIPSLVQNMTIIFNRTNAVFSASRKAEKITEEGLNQAEQDLDILKHISKNISQEINLVVTKIHEAIVQAERVRLHEIARQQQEAEKTKRLAEEAAKLKARSAAASTSQPTVSTSALSVVYKTLKTKMVEYETAGAQLTKSTDRDMKMLAMNLSRAISVPISSITDRSGSDVKSRLRILVNVIKGNNVTVGNKNVSTKGNVNAVKFVVNLTAKKIVSQANEQVSANFASAFSIAFIVIGIWAESSDFGDLFLAHLHSRCIFCVPMYLLKKESQTEEEHQKLLGYVLSEDGAVEQQDKYLRRMSGLVRLYAAVIQSPLPPGVTRHPHGLSKGWAWLAEMLNMEPQPDVSATVIYDFLEVAGHALMKAYKSQFEKLLYVLCHDYYPKLKEVTGVGHKAPLIRLKNFLEKCIKEKSVPVPKGRLDKDFWNTYHSGDVVGE